MRDMASFNESSSGLRGALHRESSMRGALYRESSQRSMRSLGIDSVSTTQELDVAKMKQELAKKSNRIVQLEYELDQVKDEVSELRRKQKNDDLFKETGFNSANNTAEAAGKQGKELDTFSSDPFGSFKDNAVANHDNDFYSDKEEDDNDDWW
jgi:hypothetical protein